MTSNKDLKRLVRARMKKTGEAYTAARANLDKQPRTKASSTSEPTDFAALAGMSDEKVKAKTGCTWEGWVKALDRAGAKEMTHRDIAALVKEKYKIGPWWTQTVTVGYERILGLRARGQQRNGTFQMTKSRTYDVPVAALFDAWMDATTRKRWLNATVKVRTATPPKSMRLHWVDGGIVAVGFAAKGKSKSSVSVEHTKLADQSTANSLKSEWSDHLDALREVFSATGTGQRSKRGDPFAQFFAGYPSAVGELAAALREKIRTVVPDASETLDVADHIVGYAVGGGYSGVVCAIIPSKTGVKLGIGRGASLPDPRGLLEGAGKRHRYVQLHTPADLARTGIDELLRAARQATVSKDR